MGTDDGEDNLTEVASTVREIVAEELTVDPKDVTEESSFVRDLGADSLDLVELIMAFEDKFKVEIFDEQAKEISTVGQAIAGITDLLDQEGR